MSSVTLASATQPPVVAVDFETYYDAEYGLKTMGTWEYCFHKKFDAYLVAIKGNNGLSYVGHPSKFNWNQLNGCILLAHNVSFDGLVLRRLQKDGIVPKDLKIVAWHDTADMSAYLRAPRNLKGASQYLLGTTMSKATRDFMKGKHYGDAVSAGMEQELLRYGGFDADLTLQLWEKHGNDWPDCEKEMSRISREAAWRGVHVNTEALDHALRGLGAKKFVGWETGPEFKGIEIQLFEALKQIPWAVRGDDTPLSIEALRKEARACGIDEMPSSLAEKSVDAQVWINKYSDKAPWIRAIGIYRKANTLHKKLLNLEGGIHDGVFSYQNKYFGAHTGRDSSGDEDADGGKFNIKNMYRKPVMGINFRSLIVAAPGKVFLLNDYEQIEARMLLWRVGDTRFVDLLKAEGNLYQAYAKKLGRYSGSNLKKDNADLYQHSKVAVLSSGYQCGGPKYKMVALSQYGLDLTLDQAWSSIYEYRNTFPLVPKHWRECNDALLRSLKDPTHVMELVSGRCLTYYDPHRATVAKKNGRAEIVARNTMGGKLVRLYGGKLTENEIQATCRDILRDGVLSLDSAGYYMPFTVYDEVAFEMDRKDAENPLVREDIRKRMCESSKWAEGAPIAVEPKVTEYYTK